MTCIAIYFGDLRCVVTCVAVQDGLGGSEKVRKGSGWSGRISDGLGGSGTISECAEGSRRVWAPGGSGRVWDRPGWFPLLPRSLQLCLGILCVLAVV